MTTINWQQPYVNTFKHFTIASDRNVVKHGDISNVMVSNIKLVASINYYTVPGYLIQL